MRAMVLEAPGRGLVERMRVAAGARAGAGAGARWRRAPSAGPTCTSSTANCRIRSCRSFRATRSSAASSQVGEGVEAMAPGDRVGVPWLGWTCGQCRYCRSGQENLCPDARFTGYQIDGGYAEYAVADARYCFPIPRRLWRRRGRPAAVRRPDRPPLPAAWPATPSGSASTASAPLPTSSPRWRATRAGGSSPSPGRATREAQAFARRLGAEWAGDADELPPEELDAAILFAPVGALVPAALAGDPAGRHRRLRRHPHERHPVVPVRPAVAGEARRLGRQPDPARRRGVPGAGAAGAGAHRDRDPAARRRPTRRCAGCATAC